MIKIVFSILLCCHVHMLHGQLTPAVIDSLELRLTQETNNAVRVDLMNDLSIRYYRVSVQREQEYANDALLLAQEIGYKKGETTALKNIGIAQRTKGAALDSILYYYNKALVLAEENDFIDLKIALLNNIGLSLGEHGQYHEALNYMLRCIDLEEANMPITWKRALILANVGSLYFQLKDYEKALSYLNSSYDMGIEHGYHHINLMHVDDLALTKYRLGKKEDAQKIILESLERIREEGDYESLYQSMLALMDIRLEENITAGAKTLGLTMLKELEQHNLPMYRCLLYHRLADIEIKLKNKTDALGYSLKSLDCFNNSISNVKRTDALKRLYRAYDLRGDEIMKDSIHRAYVAAAETEINKQISLAISEEEYKYENLLNEREIELLKEKQMVSANLMRYLIAGIIGIFLLSLVALYYYLKQNKIAQILATKNKVLIQTEETLEEKNTMLEKYIESNIQLAQFAHIASHDLKSPLRTVSSFIGLAKNSAKDRLTAEEVEYIDLSTRATKDMYHLVDDLLSYSKVNALELQIEKIDINLLFDEIRNHLNYSIGENDTELKTHFDISTIHGDRIKLRQVFENLISNSIKFVADGVIPYIEVYAHDREQDWLFLVKDNGIGIDPSYINQVFEPFTQLNAKNQYSGTGLGLALCKQIIEKHKGMIWIESTVGAGTCVSFTIDKGVTQNI